MTVRPAAMCDQNRVIALLRNFYDAHRDRTPMRFEFDPVYASRLFSTHAFDKRACCFLLDVQGKAQGVLMAGAFEHPFARLAVARETVWWIEPEYRGRSALEMLRAFERWARAAGCKYTTMGALQDDSAVLTLYRRCGYQLAETHVMKPL